MTRVSEALLRITSRLPRGSFRATRLLATLDPALRDISVPLRFWPERSFRLDLRHLQYQEIWLHGCIPYQIAEDRWAAHILRPGETVYDVGANIGYTTLMYAKAVGPSGRVHAFEPSPMAMSLLERNLQPSDPVTRVSAAVGDAPGTLEFEEHEALNFSSVSGFGTPSSSRMSPQRRIRVPVTTLDLYRASVGGAAPRFVKIDVEGYEAAVFSGMRGLMAEARPILMFEAITPEERRRNLEALEAAAPGVYRVVRIAHDGRLVPVDEPEATSNFFAIPAWAEDRFAGLPPDPEPASGPGRGSPPEPAGGSAAGFLGLAALFAATRLAAAWLGVRFDARLLDGAWQLLDLDLLREQLWTSLWVLHAQPPGANLAVGLALAWAPGDPGGLLAWLFRGLGLVALLALYAVLARLVSRRIAFVCAALFCVSPQAILYENWLFYSHPVAAMLCLAAWLLQRFVRLRRARDGLALFSVLAAVVLTRSLFHLVWLLGAIALVLAAVPDRRRATAGLAALPLAAVLALYTKNLLLFGTFSASSWMGLGLWQIASWRLPDARVPALVEAGVLSPAAQVGAFEDLDAYAPFLPPREPSGIAALDRPRKANGQPNYNAAGYLDAAALQRRNALALIRARPGRYLGAVARSLSIYFVPSTDYVFLDDNRSRIRALERAGDLLSGQILDLAPFGANQERAPPGSWKRLLHMGIVLVLLIPVLAATGAVFAWRQRHARPAAAATVAFAVYCVAYVTAVGNLFELGENNRFRFCVEPMLVLLGGLAVQRLLDRRRRINPPAPEDVAGA